MERIIKIIAFIFFIISLIVSTILIIVISNNKQTILNLYTVMENRSYIYEEGRRFNISVYSNLDNNLTIYPSENEYYLILDNYEQKLTNPKIEEYKGLNDKLYKYEFDLPKPSDVLSSDNAIFKIVNSKFSVALNIGTMTILNHHDYELLSVNKLYGSFDIIGGEKRLVGINVILNKKYEYLTKFKLGKYSYGYLSKSLFDQKFDYSIDINKYINNYVINKIEDGYILGLASNNLFIPITYMYDYILKESYITLSLDGKDYYIDNFSYLVNELDPNDYIKTKSIGEIKYVQDWKIS